MFPTCLFPHASCQLPPRRWGCEACGKSLGGPSEVCEGSRREGDPPAAGRGHPDPRASEVIASKWRRLCGRCGVAEPWTGCGQCHLPQPVSVASPPSQPWLGWCLCHSPETASGLLTGARVPTSCQGPCAHSGEVRRRQRRWSCSSLGISLPRGRGLLVSLAHPPSEPGSPGLWTIAPGGLQGIFQL